MTWSEFVATLETPELPAIERDVPEHPVHMLKGCGEGDLHLLSQMIGEAKPAPGFRIGVEKCAVSGSVGMRSTRHLRLSFVELSAPIASELVHDGSR